MPSADQPDLPRKSFIARLDKFMSLLCAKMRDIDQSGRIVGHGAQDFAHPKCLQTLAHL